MSTSLTVDITADRCVGAGHCVLSAPEVFDQREEDGIVVLVDPRPPASAHTGVRRAALACPVAAIHLTESEPT